MNILAGREHGFEELCSKLGRKFDDEQLIREQVERLRDENLQSDVRTVESLINGRVRKGQGPMKIRMDLRAKGIDDATVEQGLRELAIDWQAQADTVYRKKYSSRCDGVQERAKRLRFMQSRGFGFDDIAAITDLTDF